LIPAACSDLLHNGVNFRFIIQNVIWGLISWYFIPLLHCIWFCYGVFLAMPFG
jgi:hypothetical protein